MFRWLRWWFWRRWLDIDVPLHSNCHCWLKPIYVGPFSEADVDGYEE